MTLGVGSFVTVAVNTGLMGCFFYWATQQLIPQLRREREDTLHIFQQELINERDMHNATMLKVVEANMKAVEGLLNHLNQDHLTLRR